MASTITQPEKDRVVAALRRNGVDVPNPEYWVLRPDGWLDVKLDEGGGVALPPADILPGPDCFGHLTPHPECVGRTSCPRQRACSE